LLLQSAGPVEVRQLVTFRFLPGKTAAAVDVMKKTLLPLYGEAPALVRLRSYREAESPEPLDLVLVTSLRGMEGMDLLNAQLRELAAKTGGSLGQLYGAISDLSAHHHDQFVEMLDGFAEGTGTGASLHLFEYLRVTPGSRGAFESEIASSLVPFEKSRESRVLGTETGRFLIADGWDYLRILRFGSLGDFHEYNRAVARLPRAEEIERRVAARKRIFLREVPELAVR
jgi:hypothetical protein